MGKFISFSSNPSANILTAPLRNFLKNDEVMKMTKGMTLEDLFIDTEYMQTVVIILTAYDILSSLSYYLVLKRKTS